MPDSDDVIDATVPVVSPPGWAVLQRYLIQATDAAWRAFERRFCADDGSLIYQGAMDTRDGADDFYEPFFNWPTFAMVAGSNDILLAAKRHWIGVTAQLTELGMLRDEYERGYDWFHQGESALLFLGLCAADPADNSLRDRAHRFARLFVTDSPTGNYDGRLRMFRAPHIGSDGPRPGLGDWAEYTADQPGMRPYGLPLRDIEGIQRWQDLEDPENARRMGQAMQERLGVGDIPVSLAATSLVANAWLFGNDDDLAQWVEDYVSAWISRAEGNGGLIPDNVGPSGAVGELHGGSWHGGHYGWTWPHGLHSVEAGALLAAINHALVTGTRRAFDLARTPVDTVLERATYEPLRPDEASLAGNWRVRLPDPSAPVQLVPYRVDSNGWFDWMPLQLAFPVWLWASSGDERDKARLDELRENSGYDWSTMVSFRSKEEAGHEDGWYAWLQGDYPGYPEDALNMAIGQQSRRRALMEQDLGPQGDDIHRWQQVNPVVTEVLVQQITGSPAPLYNGGLPLMRLRWWDALTGAPGLPADVAALVSKVDGTELTVTIVNLSGDNDRELLMQAGTYGEDRLDVIRFDTKHDQWPGGLHAPSTIEAERTWLVARPGRSRTTIRLPHATQIEMRIDVSRGTYLPRHTTFVDGTEKERP